MLNDKGMFVCMKRSMIDDSTNDDDDDDDDDEDEEDCIDDAIVEWSDVKYWLQFDELFAL